jgi:hypothetical protein
MIVLNIIVFWLPKPLISAKLFLSRILSMFYSKYIPLPNLWSPATSTFMLYDHMTCLTVTCETLLWKFQMLVHWRLHYVSLAKSNHESTNYGCIIMGSWLAMVGQDPGQLIFIMYYIQEVHNFVLGEGSILNSVSSCLSWIVLKFSK